MAFWKMVVGHPPTVAKDAKGWRVVSGIETPAFDSRVSIQCKHYVLGSTKVEPVAYLDRCPAESTGFTGIRLPDAGQFANVRRVDLRMRHVAGTRVACSIRFPFERILRRTVASICNR